MPCVNSFFNYELATGARVAAIYTILLSCPMFEMGLWHMQDNYRYYYENYGLRHVYAIGVSYIIVSVLLLLTSVGLLVSVHKKNHLFSWPWIVINPLAMTLFMLIFIMYGFIEQALSIAEQILMFFGTFVMILFYIVVISYEQHIRKLYTSQVSVTTNQPELMQPHQYAQIPTINGNNLHPPYPAYMENQQARMNIPISPNTVPSVHFLPPVYPAPTQSNPTITPPNPAFYPQSYSEYGTYPSLTYPALFNPPNPQSAPNNSSIPPSATYNSSIPPAFPNSSAPAPY